MTAKKPNPPTVQVKHSKYQPSKKELDADLRVNASFEQAVKALARPVKIKYTGKDK